MAKISELSERLSKLNNKFKKKEYSRMVKLGAIFEISK